MKHQPTVVAVLVALGVLVSGLGPAVSAERGSEVHHSAALAEKININSADVKELMGLDGVGRKLAEKIVEYRKAHGPFGKPEELRKVEGVGAGLWERNRERVVVK
jgi:competence protein ComEA